jgi:chromate reductase, NAD(P)H dehydrogenase (quinone)
MKPIRILAISGSLRARSSNGALVQAAALLAPAGVEVDLYQELDSLPHFNPDVEETALPPAAEALRRRVEAADGLLISSPEYAHGVPGTLKNALDWLVGGHEFVGMPVALMNASPDSVHAHASLAETLTVMSGILVPPACITLPLRGRRLDAAGIAADPALGGALREALSALVEHVRLTPAPDPIV